MKSPTYLATAAAVLFTLGLATPTPPLAPKLPTRSSSGQLRLLHTSTPQAPSFRSSSSRIGLTAAPAEQESTKGGALLTSAANSFTSISATFTVPQAKVPTRGPTANQTLIHFAASFHVGIDSVSGACGSSLRAGVDIFHDGSLDDDLNDPQAWWQFSPADPVGFANFSVAEGDLVRISVSVSEVKIENFGPLALNGTSLKCRSTNGGLGAPKQTATVSVNGTGLCGQEVGWTVEDFPLAGLPNIPVALPDFGSVRFRDVGVTGGDGEKKNADGAVASDVRLQAQGGRLTACGVVDGGKEVKCDRVFE
ncbi:putative acid proteinase [Cladorrhinum sp. PSN259]|nr:putative acid proteinase [Cladorrhinum sp. PSN259]